MLSTMKAVTAKARWLGTARYALLGAAALACGGQTAYADPTMLICNNEAYRDQPPTTFTLDEAGHTISTAYQGLGQIAATFDSQKVTFKVVQGAETFAYMIDRVTGNISAVSDKGSQFPKIFTCRVGQKQF